MKTIRIGAGRRLLGATGSSPPSSSPRTASGDLDYLSRPAERTVALAPQATDAVIPAAGYDPLLDRIARGPACPAGRRGVRIITNMGAANPAALKVQEVARLLGMAA